MRIINDKFWSTIPLFVKQHIRINKLGIEVIGYFPYHTARIRPLKEPSVQIPRSFFNNFEEYLIAQHIQDNKAVYICKPLNDNHSSEPFAIMFKDDYAIIGHWEDVVKYDGIPLIGNIYVKLPEFDKKEEKRMFTSWPDGTIVDNVSQSECAKCGVNDHKICNECMNVPPLKKD